MKQGSWPNKVASYLLGKHSTPCPITHKCPAELLMGRRFHTTLDWLHPNYNVDYAPNRVPDIRQFQVGGRVFAKNFARDPPNRALLLQGPTARPTMAVPSRPTEALWKQARPFPSQAAPRLLVSQLLPTSNNQTLRLLNLKCSWWGTYLKNWVSLRRWSLVM